MDERCFCDGTTGGTVYTYDYALDCETCPKCGSFKPPLVDAEDYYTDLALAEERERTEALTGRRD